MKKLAFFCLFLIGFIISCTSSINQPDIQDNFSPYTADPVPEGVVTTAVSPPYQSPAAFDPQSAQFYDLVNEAMALNEAEYAMLTQNGFVISDRLTWNRFMEAYAWIYWQDLPVFVTTDSMLQAVHQSYGDILADLEGAFMQPELESFLRSTQAQVLSDHRGNSDPALDNIYADVETYLAVALALLNGGGGSNPEQAHIVQLATEANSMTFVSLFGTTFPVDFTMFQPRGYYPNKGLSNYFRAMSWLSLIDFQFVTYNPRTSEPELQPPAIAAAFILQNAIEQAGEQDRWQQMNDLIAFFAGQSDNIALPDLARLGNDLGVVSPVDVLGMAEAGLLQQLEENDYGQQRITGQIIYRNASNSSPEAIPRPQSFKLFGQRFSIDPYIMSNLVYDRLIVDEVVVERPLPSAMDVMYALGNNRAAAHLESELAAYGYESNLAWLRQEVDGLDDSFWQAPLYNRWLSLLRSLNQPTTEAIYPTTMRSTAWADKMLHTQLASWAQLRHDNILYTKQSFTTAQILCEYPAGYVEPYPEFYGGLKDMAAFGHNTVARLVENQPPAEAKEILQATLDYFAGVAEIAEQLQILAEKELEQVPFTTDEEQFLKSIVVRQNVDVVGCGGPSFEEQWNGWYGRLFYQKDENPAVVADVHTNPTRERESALYPPRVMHVATGPTAAILFLLETEEGTTLYVGPAFTYFEAIEMGTDFEPPNRLTDETWRERLGQAPYPEAPEWVTGFRLPVDAPPVPFLLPRN